ncbi:TPA: hypothetical protein QDZ99_002966 [Stenotrophomonas maltophilia]|nr:hypothetical protein [Stenotrophomonas maltophilia]HDS1157210.1 hypothetical protein [Stenotrophomonas maltophilia]HDS1167641.1 hypothetical protein [Stenotrophomonas maltophilia]HDS1171241.1 hypothetical protein [Stenotrophomonas maltophilia]HDS1175025.1 hypothetical protein [Stenotrophomonas maltophilia]
MPEFKPGWYKVGGADSDGNQTLLHFETDQMVTAECYLTADGRRIWVGANRRPVPWQTSYVFVPNDPKGHWDNKAVAGKQKSAGRGGRAGQAQGQGARKTPCEDASLACEICDQKGFPILPLRYAVARNDLEPKAPSLKDQFGDGVTSINLPEAHAKYTLRVLRSGYLYVFNETRGDWRGYIVAADGYLLEYDVNEGAPPDVGDAKPCARMAKSMSSRCIVIPDAKRAGKIWLGFSDTAWTSAVLDNNRKESYRVRHMRCIDVGAWVSSARQQKHIGTLDKLNTQVAEFSMPLPPQDFLKPDFIPPLISSFSYALRLTGGGPAFSHSLQPFKNLSMEAHDLLTAASDSVKSFSPTCAPIMVALNDPVGIASELSALMSQRLQAQLSIPSIKWPLVTSAAIDSLQSVVKNKEISEFISRRGASGSIFGGNLMLVGALGGDKAKRNAEEASKILSTASADETEKAAAEKWNLYLDKLKGGRSSPQYKIGQSEVRKKLAEFDRDVIVPLAVAHKAWMSGDILHGSMECNHDDQDPISGQGYADALTLCIQDSQDKKICFDYYKEWMLVDSISRENIILRALFLNQEKMIQDVNKLISGGRLNLDFAKGLPWDALIASYENLLKPLGSAGEVAIVRLSACVGSVLMAVADGIADRAVGPALIAMGVVAGAPVVKVRWRGSRAEAIKELILRMQAVNPELGELNKLALQSAIRIEMKRAGMYGSAVGGGDFEYVILADRRVIDDFPANVEGAFNPEKKFAEEVIINDDELSKKTRLRWKELAPSNIRISFLAGIMQVVALGKLADDVDKSMIHEAKENKWRYSAGVSALIGTTSDVIGGWLESSVAVGTKLSRYIPKMMTKVMSFAGKAFGFAAGAVMAFWDLKHGLRELHEGNAGVGVLYLISAALGVGAIVAFSSWAYAIWGAAATGVGIFLVVVLIIIACLIELWKDDKLQDWLERCYFGKFEDGERYGSFEQQSEQLQIALKG